MIYKLYVVMRVHGLWRMWLLTQVKRLFCPFYKINKIAIQSSSTEKRSLLVQNHNAVRNHKIFFSRPWAKKRVERNIVLRPEFRPKMKEKQASIMNLNGQVKIICLSVYIHFVKFSLLRNENRRPEKIEDVISTPLRFNS